MVVEEWLAEDFPLKIDQSTNTTKFASCASHWDMLIQSSKKSLTQAMAGLEQLVGHYLVCLQVNK
jgi:hypothetical protein